MCAHENRDGPYASFCALVKDFLEFDSISTIQRSVGKGPTLQIRSHFRIIAICLHPNPVIGFDNL
jgi:hypothetical protein